METARRGLGSIAAAALALLAGPALADGWSFRAASGGGSAGYAAGGGYSGLWLACSPSGARLSVSTGGTRLQAGVDQTAVVSVDGTAFLQRMRTAAEGGEPILRRRLVPGELETLAAALGKGRKAEVSMPAGRFILPLKGSGKALAGLLAVCR